MNSLLIEYLPILIFLGLAVGLALAIVTASLIVARQKPDQEKLSAYECGFEPFEDARVKFDVRFYLVAILFIICLLYTSPSPRDLSTSRMPSSA